MDIFTTQLTRVVQTPIKSASLKVKALLKESGSGKLKEDLDHLENHQYYFFDEEGREKGEQSKQSQRNDHGVNSEDDERDNGSFYLVQEALNKDEEDKQEEKPQLDLYV